MDLGKRLLELTEGADFHAVTTFNSVSELVTSAEDNLSQYEKLAAKGKDHLERIQNLVFLLLAKEIQPRAFEAHGDISDASVRKFLQKEFSNLDLREKWKGLVKQAMATQGLSNDQLTKPDNLSDLWPSLVIEFFVEGIGRFRHIPAAEIPRLASALAEMFMEGEGYADRSRLN